MAAQSKFEVTVKYVTNDDGDTVILPDEGDIRRAEGALEAATAELDAKRAELEKLLGSPPEGEADAEADLTAKAEALRIARDAYLFTAGRVAAQRDWIEKAKAVLDTYGKDAKTWKFDMHRYSWLEREQAKQEAREFSADGGFTLNEQKLVLGLLERCIDSWSLKRKEITAASIDEELPAAAVDRLYRLLAARSEASHESLPFPGGLSPGSVARQAAHAG